MRQVLSGVVATVAEPSSATTRPGVRSSIHDWRSYALSLGHPLAAVEAATKTELFDLTSDEADS
jgi:hypothetical protein